MMKLTSIVLAAICVSWNMPVYADGVSKGPDCLQPSRPDFQLQSEYADFKQAINTYQRCIERYIAEQEQAAQEHRDAAEDARQAWDHFVSTELR